MVLKRSYSLVPGSARISPYTARRNTIVILSQVIRKNTAIRSRWPYLAVYGRKREWVFNLGQLHLVINKFHIEQDEHLTRIKLQRQEINQLPKDNAGLSQRIKKLELYLMLCGMFSMLFNSILNNILLGALSFLLLAYISFH